MPWRWNSPRSVASFQWTWPCERWKMSVSSSRCWRCARSFWDKKRHWQTWDFLLICFSWFWMGHWVNDVSRLPTFSQVYPPFGEPSGTCEVIGLIIFANAHIKRNCIHQIGSNCTYSILHCRKNWPRYLMCFSFECTLIIGGCPRTREVGNSKCQIYRGFYWHLFFLYGYVHIYIYIYT